MFKAYSDPEHGLNPQRDFLLSHLNFNKNIIKAKGHYYYDENNNAYFDGLAQYGAIPFGHNPDDLVQIIQSTLLSDSPTFMQPFMGKSSKDLSTLLCSLYPNMRYATFVNSGAEASESAIKLSRGKTGRSIILGTKNGYHGKTLGALSVTGNNVYKDPFLLNTQAFEHIEYNNIEALEQRLKFEDVAAFFIEPVQGEGGMKMPSKNYLSLVSKVCKKYGTLMVLDEVQTGFGRSGKLFAIEYEEDCRPDIVLLAKALGGGMLPIGVMLCSQKAWLEEFGFLHSSTFANHFGAGELAIGVINKLQNNNQEIVKNANRRGIQLSTGLENLCNQYPNVFKLHRGIGLMQGIVFQPWSGNLSYFNANASENGYAVPIISGYLLNHHKIVTAPVFNQSATLRLQPSLTVTAAEIDLILNALDDVGNLIRNKNFSKLMNCMVQSDTYLINNTNTLSDENSIQILGNIEDKDLSSQDIQLNNKGNRRGGFAFLIHPTDEEILFNTLSPDFNTLDINEKNNWQEWMKSWFEKMYQPSKVFHLQNLQSKQGGYVEGWLIACPLLPQQMLRLTKVEKQQLMQAYVEQAKKLDINIIGLGAFTSVISRGGLDLDYENNTITSGNSLTALFSADSFIDSIKNLNKDLVVFNTGVLGAAGSVGRLCAIHIANDVQNITLLGNQANKLAIKNLQMVGGEIYRLGLENLYKNKINGLASWFKQNYSLQELDIIQNYNQQTACHEDFYNYISNTCADKNISKPVICSTDVHNNIKNLDGLICASSAGTGFITLQDLKDDVIVCDVARPLDIVRQNNFDKTKIVYEGGVVKLPEHISFGHQNILGYPVGYNLACLSETMVLAMEGVTQSHSIGNQINYANAVFIRDAAIAHGFNYAILDSVTKQEHIIASELLAG